MTQYFIIVAADEHKSRLNAPSAHQLAIYRLANKKWGLNSRTRNRKSIARGDEVLIYAAGKRVNGMTFVGRARIAEAPLPIRGIERIQINSPSAIEMAMPCDYGMFLEKIDIFKIPVPIKSVFRKFSWVRNPDNPHWGGPLMGGAMRISKSDFQLVVRKAGNPRPSKVVGGRKN